MSLYKTSNYINTTFMEAFRFLKHREGFAYTRTVTEINFQFAFLRSLDKMQKTVIPVTSQGLLRC